MTSSTMPGRSASKRSHRMRIGFIKQQSAYLTMLIPGLILLFLFCYLPMPGVILAFKKYRLAVPPKDFWVQNKFIYSLFFKSDWVGLDNFRYLLKSDAWTITRNTVGYNLLFMSVGLVLSVSLAVAVNELRNRLAAKIYHTILFMPFFISWIVVMYALYAFISSRGLFNQISIALGRETCPPGGSFRFPLYCLPPGYGIMSL